MAQERRERIQKVALPAYELELTDEDITKISQEIPQVSGLLLFEAIDSKNPEAVINHLKKGAKLNTTKNKLTPIVYAATIDAWDCVEAIANQQPTNAQDTFEYGVVLTMAVEQKKIPTALLLLEKGASLSLNPKNNYFTALYWAVEHDERDLVVALLKHGAKQNVRIKDQIPFTFACEKKAWGLARVFMNHDSFNTLFKRDILKSCILAIQDKQFDLAKDMLMSQRKPKDHSTEGYSVLHWAVETNDLDLVRACLEQGIDQTLENDAHETAIELACRLGHSVIAIELIAANNISQNKHTAERMHYFGALLHSIKLKKYALVKLLLINHTPYNMSNNSCGNVLLHTCIVELGDDVEMLQLLLKHGAEPAMKNKEGYSIYHFAEHYKAVKCAEQLRHYANLRSTQPSSFTFDYRQSLNLSQAKYQQKAEDLSKKLQDNSLASQLIPQSMRELTHYLRALMIYQLETLEYRREYLKKQPANQDAYCDKESSQTHTQTEVEQLIQTIHSLMKDPNYRPPLNSLPEMNFVHAYVNSLGRLNEFKNRVISCITLLNKHLNKDLPNFKIKNFLGTLVTGAPEHVKQIAGLIRVALDKLSTPRQVFESFKTIIEILEQHQKFNPSCNNYVNDFHISGLKLLKIHVNHAPTHDDSPPPPAYESLNTPHYGTAPVFYPPIYQSSNASAPPMSNKFEPPMTNNY